MLEWHRFKKLHWSEGYQKDILKAFRKDVFLFVGNLPIANIEPATMFDTLRKIENRGAIEKAGKIRRWCSEVFRYAIATGRAKFNPIGELKSAISEHVSSRYTFLKAEELPNFLIAVEGYSGRKMTQLGLKILMLSGLRTIELRIGKCKYVNFENATLSIPSNIMKMNWLHVVPLSAQLIELLQELKTLSGRYENMFPGCNDPLDIISKNTINQMIKHIGYKRRVVGHGFCIL